MTEKMEHNGISDVRSKPLHWINSPDYKNNISIRRYTSADRDLWNSFVDKAKNGLFLFDRNYMEYHQNRFYDFSLLFYKDNHLIAILPAHREGNTLASHEGLTFGGFICYPGIRAATMLALFKRLIEYAAEYGIIKIRYKCIPYIYHSIPSEEDLYVLFVMGGRLVQRDITQSINLINPPAFSKGRRYNIRCAAKKGLLIHENENYEGFWRILEKNLMARHKKRPVHSLSEIEHLHGRFPKAIRLFSCMAGDEILGGAVIFEYRQVAHVQYLAVSGEGRKIYALDFLISGLIKDIFRQKNYFDFGISTTGNGMQLNQNLEFYKTGFGAGSVIHEIFEVDI
jgi:hypothetical protein